jgi:hypothetical protein
MKLIPPQIEKNLEEQEKHPDNTLFARKLLETALAHQLMQLSDGLLAWLILHGTQVEKAVWQHKYNTFKNLLFEKYYEDDERINLTFKEYVKDFSKNIVTGKIEVISVTNINDIRLRIYGGYVKLWDISRVNDQLSTLGSEYRLAFLGQEEALYNEIINFLSGTNLSPHSIDARFIFGKVGAVTALPFCPLFHFETELVTSPFLKPTAGGFTFNHDHVVIRQYVLDYLENSSKAEEVETQFESQESRKLHFLHSLTHESIHVFDFSERQRYPYNLFKWRENTKRDILRYLQSPKSIEDLRNTFKVNFENTFLQENNFWTEYSSNFLGVNLIEFIKTNSLENILDEMRSEGSIYYEGQLLQSSIFREGNRWEF